MLPVVKGILKGERRSLARAISIIDNDDHDSQIIIRQIFDKTGKARAVGFTGPAGGGKKFTYRKISSQFSGFGIQGCCSCSRSNQSNYWRSNFG